MTLTIINDCRDANAAGRQIARAGSLLNAPVAFIGVANDLEAAGNLVDALDALEGRPGVILVNVAPRNGRAREWENGTPFGYFWHGEALVIASVDGLTLSLVKKLKVVETIRVINSHEALGKSQFRSYEFLPRVAARLLKRRDVPSTPLDISDAADAPHAVWWVDNFGNCKTTLLPEDVSFRAGASVATLVDSLACFAHLKDVPDDTPALVAGSSGLGEKRFLEIVVQGGNAAGYYHLSSGDRILP